VAWLQLGVHVVFMIGNQVDRLWGRDFYMVATVHWGLGFCMGFAVGYGTNDAAYGTA